ncbi:hypothetical protein D9611_005826 [Ephemerocybe angulata]|uniref:Uncharacterized protein n=1 Tax=Ephemerocybe angulata TaxID=980116 RepID=A0A8H5F4H1_9AGAR|nr:hypothetical protein D9611_005826 [Tulosesus angulatus]
MFRLAAQSTRASAFCGARRQFHVTPIAAKTVKDTVKDVAQDVNLKLGKKMASAIDKGEELAEAAKSTLGIRSRDPQRRSIRSKQASAAGKQKVNEATQHGKEKAGEAASEAGKASTIGKQKMNQAATGAREAKDDFVNEWSSSGGSQSKDSVRITAIRSRFRALTDDDEISSSPLLRLPLVHHAPPSPPKCRLTSLRTPVQSPGLRSTWKVAATVRTLQTSSIDPKYVEKLKQRAKEAGLTLEELAAKAKEEAAKKKQEEREALEATLPIRQIQAEAETAPSSSTSTASSEKPVERTPKAVTKERKDSSPVKPLSSILNLERIFEKPHTAEQIASLWTVYHAKASAEPGAEYKQRQSFATPYLITTFYTDLATTHNTVLMRGEITPSAASANPGTADRFLLSQEDTQVLIMMLQRFYLWNKEGDAEALLRPSSKLSTKAGGIQWEDLVKAATVI